MRVFDVVMLNASDSIVVIVEGINIEVNPVFLNAEFRIVVNNDGKLIFCKLIQFSKAFEPIVVISSGIVKVPLLTA